MALVSTRIHRRRQRALHRLEPIAQRWQAHLSGGTEALELHYKPGSKLDGEDAEEPWRLAIEEQLRQQRERRNGSAAAAWARTAMRSPCCWGAARHDGLAPQASSGRWCWA